MLILNRIISRISRKRLHKRQVDLEYTYIGTKYGGWPVLKDSLSSRSIVLSFGLGIDISFDLGLIEKFQCNVIGFDPTPRSIRWLSGLNLPPQFVYHGVGIAAEDGEIAFMAPKKEEHVSFHVDKYDADNERETISAPVLRLSSIIEKYDIGTVDILKMDIEGFEYDVLRDISSGTIRPKQVLVEFHHGMYGIDDAMTNNAVKLMNDIGYKIFYVSDIGLEYAFVYDG